MSTMMDGFLWLGPTRVTDSPAHKGPCGLCPPNHPITIPPDTMVLIQLPKCSDQWCHLELTNPSPPPLTFLSSPPIPGRPCTYGVLPSPRFLHTELSYFLG